MLRTVSRRIPSVRTCDAFPGSTTTSLDNVRTAKLASQIEFQDVRRITVGTIAEPGAVTPYRDGVHVSKSAAQYQILVRLATYLSAPHSNTPLLWQYRFSFSTE